MDSRGGIAAGVGRNAFAATKDAVARKQHRGCRLLRRLNWPMRDEAAVAKEIISLDLLKVVWRNPSSSGQESIFPAKI